MPKNKTKIPVEQGTCPKCGGHNLEYGVSHVESESLGYYYHCPDCKRDGVEWYDITFSSHCTLPRSTREKYEYHR